MNFLNAAALGFAAAIPVVVLFYLLKRKRVVRLVSSTLLWQKFLAETQASAPFQRLRHNWLLILQILLLALAVLALARPFFSGLAAPTRLLVVVLDASASMQATDEKPSRFEKARAQALQLVDSMHGEERMMVLLAGARTEVKQSPTTDKAALRRALQACQVTDSSTHLNDALKTAAAFTFEKKSRPDTGNGKEVVTEETSGEIHLFSDGAAPSLEEFETKALPLVYHRLGERCSNLGFVSLEVRANPDNAAQRAIFTSIRNPGPAELAGEVELRFEDQSLEIKPVSVPASNTLPLVFFAAQPRDGVFTVRLNTPDDLAADNQASVVSLLPQTLHVLLVTRGNRFLEKSLRAAGHVQLEVVSSLSEPAANYDVVVLDDITPLVWLTVNTLAIHIVNTNWFGTVSRQEAPAIVDWKTGHPLLRFVSFDTVAVSETLAVSAPTWGQAIVESPQTPLIVAGEVNQRRLIWIGFDTLQSTWPLRVSFPIFIANAVEWLNPASASGAQLTVHVGEALRHRFVQPEPSARVTRPDGTVQALTLEPNTREVAYGDTARQGVYHLQAGTNAVAFCVNLLDPAETAIAPRSELPMGKAGSVAATTLKRASKELWRWLLGAALLVLLFEWWFYHKRTV